MISDQFKKDYRQMVAKGVKFTPEDIVRLNALAVRVRLSQDSARTVHLPRLAFMPRDSWWREPIIFREPTIAHELWIEEAARWIDTSDDRNFLWLHGYALSRKADRLVDAFDPKRLVRTIYRFAARRLCGFTCAQLSAAVEYVLFGANWMVDERGPRSDAKRAAPDPAPETPSPTIGLIVRARAERLPISLDDARQMTASELEETIHRHLANEGRFDWDAERRRAFGEYVRARNAVRDRSSNDGGSQGD